MLARCCPSQGTCTRILPEYDGEMVSTEISKFQRVLTVAEVAHLDAPESTVEVTQALGRHSVQRHLLARLGTSILCPGVRHTTWFHPTNANTST